MAKKTITQFPETREALKVLGQQIRMARAVRKWTAADLATKIGVSESTILAMEKGSPGTSIGSVFNAAVMCGVALFGAEDPVEIARLRRAGDQQLALIASRVYKPRNNEPDDNF